MIPVAIAVTEISDLIVAIGTSGVTVESAATAMADSISVEIVVIGGLAAATVRSEVTASTGRIGRIAMTGLMDTATVANVGGYLGPTGKRTVRLA